MEGTIKIEALKGIGVSIEAEVANVSRLDVIAVLDGVLSAFKIDEEDRKIIGITLAMGGVNAIPGVARGTIELDTEALELLKKMKETKDGQEG